MFKKTLSQFENKNILIVGMAREGLSTVQFLLKHVPSAKLKITDIKNQAELDQKWAPLLKENQHLELINSSAVKDEDLDFIFRAPGVNLKILHQKYQPNSKAIITSNTQLFFDLISSLENSTRLDKKPLTIGVTGTKGKTTTTAQIHHLLQVAAPEITWEKLNNPQIRLGGNIGVPPLRLLEDNPHPEKDIFVLELSCHQLSDLKTSPQMSVIQDISPDHLDYYATFEKYIQAKTAICKNQIKSDLVIYNADSKSASAMAQLSPGEKIPFSLNDVKLIDLIKSAPSPLAGKHNLYNTLPGIIIANRLGITNLTIKKALTTFKGVPHRLELVKTVHKVRFYNDSAASAPEAAIAGIKAFAKDPLILIAGGSDKNVSFTKLADTILNSKIKFIIFFPTTGEKILDAMRQLDAHHPLINNNQFASSMAEAVNISAQRAQPGDVVLLSPACASFNMFKSYEDRGNQFRELAQQI